MGRIGVLPSKLSTVHHRYQTPIWAINVQTLITLILTLGTGFLFGIFNAGSFTAEVLTLAIIVVYIMGNVALPFFYWREYRKEFRWGLHVILPIIASLFLLVALYGSVFPVPAYPLNLVPYVVLVWLLIGVGVLSWLKKHRPAAVEAAKVVFLPTETESVEQGQG
jgi:amino acid transporter